MYFEIRKSKNCLEVSFNGEHMLSYALLCGKLSLSIHIANVIVNLP